MVETAIQKNEWTDVSDRMVPIGLRVNDFALKHGLTYAPSNDFTIHSLWFQNCLIPMFSHTWVYFLSTSKLGFKNLYLGAP